MTVLGLYGSRKNAHEHGAKYEGPVLRRARANMELELARTRPLAKRRLANSGRLAALESSAGQTSSAAEAMSFCRRLGRAGRGSAVAAERSLLRLRVRHHNPISIHGERSLRDRRRKARKDRGTRCFEASKQLPFPVIALT